jgi:hypothetical protein
MDSNVTLTPLKITCTSTRCHDNLHCFRLNQRLKRTGPEGRCRQCNVELIDWSRIKRRNIADVDHTIAALQLELIRHHFWHLGLSEYAANYAVRKGKIALRDAVNHQLEKAIGSPNHPRQGRQTPRENSRTATAVHYAQHATGTCCRACLEEWHGIESGADLTKTQLQYLTNLVMKYVDVKLPELEDEPQKLSRQSPRREMAKQVVGAYALAS